MNPPPPRTTRPLAAPTAPKASQTNIQPVAPLAAGTPNPTVPIEDALGDDEVTFALDRLEAAPLAPPPAPAMPRSTTTPVSGAPVVPRATQAPATTNTPASGAALAGAPALSRTTTTGRNIVARTPPSGNPVAKPTGQQPPLRDPHTPPPTPTRTTGPQFAQQDQFTLQQGSRGPHANMREPYTPTPTPATIARDPYTPAPTPPTVARDPNTPIPGRPHTVSRPSQPPSDVPPRTQTLPIGSQAGGTARPSQPPPDMPPRTHTLPIDSQAGGTARASTPTPIAESRTPTGNTPAPGTPPRTQTLLGSYTPQPQAATPQVEREVQPVNVTLRKADDGVPQAIEASDGSIDAALGGLEARPEPSRPKSQSMTSVLSDHHFPRPGTGGSHASPPSFRPNASIVPKKENRPALEISENMQIGRFGLIREIARGGMGQVFLARDTKLGRRVAIKFLLNDDPNLAQRFLVEARATARCMHENIVTIHEVGEHAGLPFMVLEYLEGKTLSQALETRPQPRQFAEIMISVFRALDRAHEHGIVHRDLKPSNIFITDRGQVKVLDFGVARIFDQPDPIEQVQKPQRKDTETGEGDPYVTFTGGGTLVGTLPYMSPEQWGAGEVDHQSDLWACGIMFWRALTGVHPAGTMNQEKLRARLTDLETPLPSIGSREPSLPRELVTIVDMLLRKKKAERYSSAAKVVEALQAFLAPKGVYVSEDACPYRGLASFGEGDAKFFFGRSNEIRTALGQLDAWPLLAVIGPSGVGKSSFVHAGLVPAVRGTGGNWQIRVLRPGRQPLQSLAATLDDAIETGQVAAEIIDRLYDAPGFYGELLRKAAQRKKHRVLIVVDQLEELFTLSDNDEIRKVFLAALLAAADDPSSPIRIVLSMRADFLDRLANHKTFLAEISRGLFFLSAPDQDNLRETLVRPAELAGYSFEETWIVDDMMQAATSKGALPLLQFAATRMWDARDRENRLLTAAAYSQMGGVGGAFARHADEVAAAVPPQSQPLLRAIMTRLVTPEGTRAVIDHKELLGLSKDRKEVERILDQLVHARLISMQTEGGSGTTVEIVHEVLISEWPMLARWLEDSQSLRGFMQELRQAVKQWIARGKRTDLLWRGATAQDALATAKRHVLDLSSSEKEFLDAVRREAGRSRRRRVAAVGFVITTLVLMVAGAGFAYLQVSSANSEAQSQRERAEQKAIAADTEAKRAKEAEAKVQAQLDEVKAAEERRLKAEAERQSAEEAAAKANETVAETQEDLAKANKDLRKALEASQRDKQTALDAAKRAADAAAIAKKATDDAKAANSKLQSLLAVEKERVKQLEAEKAKISTGGLR